MLKMGYYNIINRVKWYYRLKPQTIQNGNKYNSKGLFSDNPRHTLTNSLIVAVSHYNPGQNKTYLLFAVFKTYLEYGIYQMKLPQHQRCFYEIVLGESTQKPHFDVDIDDVSVDGEKIKDNLIDSAIAVLKEKDVDILISDILVYTSHGKEKHSYHIIINNYCHANNIEAKAFYDKVIDKVNPNYVKWIDRSVYSPTQQFRIVGSQKIGSERIKTFQKEWKHNGELIKHKYPETPDCPEHEIVMQLEESILGYTGNCKFLPAFEPREETVKHYDNDENVTADEATEAIKLVGIAGNISINDYRFPYRFQGINGPIVMLKRTKPSRCKLCERVHEHENPYLLVLGEERSVYFCCRRSAGNKKLFLGKLEPNNSETEKTEPEETQSMDNIRINWTKNVLARVKKIAKSDNNNNSKKYINGTTELDPVHKKKLIQMYLDN